MGVRNVVVELDLLKSASGARIVIRVFMIMFLVYGRVYVLEVGFVL